MDADLRSALRQEQVDLDTINADTASLLKHLWTDRVCRARMLGELPKFTRSKIGWTMLLREAEVIKKHDMMAVRNFLEKEVGVSSGAADAVSRYVYRQIQLSRSTLPLSFLCMSSVPVPCSRPLCCTCSVTPFMRALGEFPRHIYHNGPLTPDREPWMPKVRPNNFCLTCVM